MVHITPPDQAKDVCLLLIRLIVGFSFIIAARNKSRNIKKFSKNNGLPVPAAVVVMCLEFISGTALILGIWEQIAAIVIMVLMLGTLRLHIFKWRSPYWASSGGWEYDLMLFAFAAVIFIFGAGSFAL
jgi:putative oxidoreductase